MAATQMKNVYANGPIGLLESIIKQSLPNVQTATKFSNQPMQQQTQQTAWGSASGAGGFGAKPGMGAPTNGFGGQPAAGGFGNTAGGFGNTGGFGGQKPGGFGGQQFGAQPQQQQPPVIGIQSEDQLKAVQQGLAMSQNLRAGVIQQQLHKQPDVIDKFSYFGVSKLQTSQFQSQQFQQSQYQQPFQQSQYNSQYGQSGQQQQQLFNPAASLQQSLQSCISLQPQIQTVPNPNLTQSIHSNPNMSASFSTAMQIKSSFLQDVAPLQQKTVKTNQNAPVLMNTEFITTPPMEKIKQMSDFELQNVQNFSIKRIQNGQMLGQIMFRTAVNLMNINLDQTIEIEHARCSVNLLTPEQFQLNVPAVISLYQITSLDPEYKTKIEQITEQIGAQLINYDPIKGEWIFEVSGFV
ncbi:Nucleoporin_autopeptidase [Hexamita inflata]|uniref:Nucleoporin autopeptidase n=1 Tax=Hexamita inflata TaxID=28002 RepID=A0AA86P3I8_9EUKA|nr:Nucleoporin autopeptidase [Hexamita inflata]